MPSNTAILRAFPGCYLQESSDRQPRVASHPPGRTKSQITHHRSSDGGRLETPWYWRRIRCHDTPVAEAHRLDARTPPQIPRKFLFARLLMPSNDGRSFLRLRMFLKNPTWTSSGISRASQIRGECRGSRLSPLHRT